MEDNPKFNFTNAFNSTKLTIKVPISTLKDIASKAEIAVNDIDSYVSSCSLSLTSIPSALELFDANAKLSYIIGAVKYYLEEGDG